MNCIGLLPGLYFGPAPLVVWRPPHSTHIQTIFFRAPGAAVLNTAASVLVGSYSGLFDWLPGPPAPVRDAFVLCRSPDFGDRRGSIDDGPQRRNRPYDPPTYPPHTIRSRAVPSMRQPNFSRDTHYGRVDLTRLPHSVCMVIAGVDPSWERPAAC